MYNGRTLNHSPLCRLEWSVGAAGQSVDFSAMTQVAAATLSSGLPDIWWKIYLLLFLPSTSLLLFSSSFIFQSLFPSLTPTFQIYCIVLALLGCHTEQDEKPGKQLISRSNWQEDGCVCACVFLLVRLYVLVIGHTSVCVCVYLLQYI